MNNFQSHLLQELTIFFSPLVGIANSRRDTILFFKDIGWHLEALAPNGDITGFITRLNSIPAAVASLQAIADTPPETLSEWGAVISNIEAATASVGELIQGFQTVSSVSELPGELINELLYIHLQRRKPKLLSLLYLIGAVDEPSVAPIYVGDRLVRERGKRPKIHLDKLWRFITRPKAQLRDTYWSSTGLATRPAANLVSSYLFPPLAGFLSELGFDTFYDNTFPFDPNSTSSASNQLAIGLLTARLLYTTPVTGLTSDFGVTLGLIPFDELSAQTSSPAPVADDAGLLLVPFGNLSFSQAFGDWLVTAVADTDLPGVQISRSGVKLLRNTGASTETSIVVDLSYQAPDSDEIRFGSTTGTRLEISQFEAHAFLAIREPQGDYGITAVLPQAKLVLATGDGDSFLNKIIGGKKEVIFDLALGWTKTAGFYIGAQGGFEHTYSVNSSGSGSLLRLSEATIGLAFSQTGTTRILALVSGSVHTGPVELSVSRTGIEAVLDFTGANGNFGPLDIALGFKLPSGIGIKIESDAVSGGGYLYVDVAAGRYAGVAGLTVKDKLKLKAVGLLQTKLRNNRPGYSFLLLITAEFTPIQLGLGFTLNGVGGLVGINRTANTDALRTLVQNGRTDTLLFPANILDNPQAAVATVDSAFPAAEGRYVFGIMAKIGWGTPNLLTLEAALIIEVPAPVRLILLGVLRAVLPNESAAIVRLRADFIGIVDFGAKKVAFDAFLVDSKILQFPLTGSFSFRLYQGDNPVFLMTAGGFHPAFTPPANADLPTLRRLTLALSQGGDFRLTLTSYLAITSNTVQFGSKLELYADLPGPFTLQGYFGFDALFQFNPFRLQVRVGAGVAIKKGSRSVLSISLDLQVSGPAPWHVEGTGKFKVLFIKVSFRIDRTFGGSVAQPALPSTNVRQLLTAALADKANWEVQQPAVKPASTVILRTEDQPSELVVDPGGALVARQKVVPLDYLVELYGNTTPTNGNQFRVSGVRLGEASNETPIPAASLGEIRDAFAPGQFRRMTDAQKLSSPSFQLMRSGLRINTVDGLTGQTGETRTQEFEQRIFTPETTDSGTANRTAPGANVATEPTPNPEPPTDVFTAWESDKFTSPDSVPFATNATQLARTGAVGRSRRSYEQRRPSRLAPDMVTWSEDSYVIVSTRDLQLDEYTPSPFRTEAEATSYLAQRLADDPELAGELQVLPVYQLDVSTPSTSANLVTV
jgi:hypothetical protein